MTFEQFVGLMIFAAGLVVLLADRMSYSWCPMPDVMQSAMLREVRRRYAEMSGGNATWYEAGKKPFRFWITNNDLDLADYRVFYTEQVK